MSREAWVLALVLGACAAPPAPASKTSRLAPATAPPAPKASATPSPPPRPPPVAEIDAALFWSEHDGALLCLGGRASRLGIDGTVRALDEAPRDERWRWSEAIASADGKSLAVFGPPGLSIVDAATGAIRTGPLARVEELATSTMMGESARFAWSPDGATLVGFVARPGADDSPHETTIALWDAASGALRTLQAPSFVSTVIWHPREPILLANSGYGSMFNVLAWDGTTVSRWQLPDGKPLAPLRGHTASFSPDGRWLAVGSGHPTRGTGGSTRVYDEKGRQRHALAGLVVGWYRDGSWMLVAEAAVNPFSNISAGATSYRVVETKTGRVRSRPALANWDWVLDPTTGLVATREPEGPDGWTFDAPILLLDLEHGGPPRPLVAKSPAMPLAWHRDGRVLELSFPGDAAQAPRARVLLDVRTGERLRIDAVIRDGRCVVRNLDAGENADGASAIAAFFARAG